MGLLIDELRTFAEDDRRGLSVKGVGLSIDTAESQRQGQNVGDIRSQDIDSEHIQG